jgi:hypothetical protein
LYCKCRDFFEDSRHLAIGYITCFLADFIAVSYHSQQSGESYKMKLNRKITIADLAAGLYPTISTAEFALLRGRSLSTIEKERTRGSGIPFHKDLTTGRISYRAEDVLNFLASGKRCTSTAQYDTSAHSRRLERARAILVSKQSSSLCREQNH